MNYPHTVTMTPEMLQALQASGVNVPGLPAAAPQGPSEEAYTPSAANLAAISGEVTGRAVIVQFRGETLTIHTSKVDNFEAMTALAQGNFRPMLDRLLPDRAQRDRLLETCKNAVGETGYLAVGEMIGEILSQVDLGK